jgi:tetratricopeptide (TPR) repeat protein
MFRKSLLMKTCLLISCLSFSITTSQLLAEEAAAPAPTAETAAPSTENLAEQIAKKMQEVQELQAKLRYVDALAKLDEVDALQPNLPDVYILRGSMYLSPALRDFSKAETMFKKAKEISPDTLAPDFNLAELRFVQQDWAGAKQGFEKALADYPKTPLNIRHLMVFKLFLTEVKLDQINQAKQTLKSNFTFMDDTPAYYFCNAVLSLQSGKQGDGEDWIKRADGIFKASENSPYKDSLMEARWLPNINIQGSN